MKRSMGLAIVAFTLVALLGGASVTYAQDISIVTMPFSFTAGNKMMPAGKYEVSLKDQAVLTLTPEKGQGTVLLVITRLAPLAPLTDARFVFDKVGNNYTLSEVWFPAQDGFLVYDTKTPHTHHVLKGEKKKT